MSDAGFFRGTSADQDNRFTNKDKKLMKEMKFADSLSKKIDMSKVKVETIKPWVTEQITKILGMEDDVVVDFVFNQLDADKNPDPKKIQIMLTGFLNGKNARIFVGELWDLLLSAQASPTGIPKVFIDQKKEEIKKKLEDDDSRSKNHDSSRKDRDSYRDRDRDRDRDRKDSRRSRSRDRSSRANRRDRSRSPRGRDGRKDDFRKGGVTTGLKNHLKFIHKLEFKLLDEEESKKMDLQKNLQKETTALEQAKAEAKQLSSLIAWLEKDKSKNIDYKLAELICLDDLPYVFVEGLGFMRLMKEISPRYQLKTRKFYANLINTSLYNSVVEAVKEIILDFKCKLSFTVDEWSNVAANVSLLSLTCHGITNDFKRMNMILCVAPLKGSHTGDSITEKFLEMINQWNIPNDKIHAVIRDAGANMKKGLRQANVNNFDCAAHKLQLVVKEGLKTQRVIIDLIAKCKRIATHFSHSIIAQEELENYQARLGQPLLKMKQDVATRWNSTFYMLKRTLEINESLLLYLKSSDSSDLPTIANNEWNIMEKCVAALDPFDQITRKFSEPNASIADVIPLIHSLQKICREQEDDSDKGILSMKQTFRTEIDKRFDYIKTEYFYSVATYLDPRYKNKFFATDELKDQVKQEVLRVCAELYAATYDDDYVAASPSKGVDKGNVCKKTTDDASKPKTTKLLQDVLLEVLLSSDSDNSNLEIPDIEEATCSVIRKKPRKEIKLQELVEGYDKEKRLEITGNPLSWWHENKERYSILSEVACNYLACPPTSVPSEQLFSTAGHIYEPKRSSLQGINAEKLMFLKYNLPVVNFQYKK